MSDDKPMDFLDFGGDDKPLCHIAHANGYPPTAYRQLASYLTPHYHAFSYYTRPFWPESDPIEVNDWYVMAEDLYDFLALSIGDQQVIGIGHSMGGIQSMIIAAEWPDIFSALVLIDPVLFTPSTSFAYGWMKRLKRNNGMPLIRATMMRRREFPNAEAMFQNYRKKTVFEGINSQGLRDYVEGLAKLCDDGSVELAYSPEWEAQIYRTAPHDGWRWPKQIQTPTLIIRGENSETFTEKAALRLERKIKNAVCYTIPNSGHLVPLEQPQAVGELIVDFLSGL